MIFYFAFVDVEMIKFGQTLPAILGDVISDKAKENEGVDGANRNSEVKEGRIVVLEVVITF